MTLTTDPRRDVVPPDTTPRVDEPRAPEPVPDYAEALPRSARRAPLTPRRLAALAATWILVTLAMPVLVLYGFGPLLEQRAQRSLLSSYRTDISHAAGEADTPFGVAAPTTAPSLGAAVGIMEIGQLRVSQVAVEGVGPEQTRKGPGHVPGTAGLGQPGNAAVVGRRAGFGGPFGSLGSLHVGDAIVVTTTQGQTLYKVSQVRQVLLEAPASASAAASSAPGGATAVVAGRLKPVMTTAELYAPSNDNRLTAVTSDAALPWATHRATVVVATMRTQPFVPTPQNGRSATADGRHGDGSVGASLVLALLAYVAAAVGSVLLYRRFSFRSAYLLSTPVLVMFALLLGEVVTRLLPAWT